MVKNDEKKFKFHKKFHKKFIKKFNNKKSRKCIKDDNEMSGDDAQ